MGLALSLFARVVTSATTMLRMHVQLDTTLPKETYIVTFVLMVGPVQQQL